MTPTSTVTYLRQPTEWESRNGELYIHYRQFDRELCLHKGKLKRWFKAVDDGLRYFLSY